MLTEGAAGIVKHGVQKVLGALLGFSKPTPTVQDVNLTIRNKVSADIKVNKSTISGGANQRFDFNEDLIGMKLGVWNLRENPTVYIHPVGVLASAPMGINSDENSYAFGTSGNYKVDVVINPEIKQYVTSVNVSCDPLRFTITDSKKKESDLPQPLKDFSDYGPLGHKTNNYIKYNLTNPIYNNDFYDIYDNGLRSHAGFYGIWQKYGKYTGRIPIYKYMCATKDQSLCRQQFVYDATYNKVRVRVTINYNYGGKEYTLTEMRTFTPKFDWDPDLVKEYNSLTINLLQGRADTDRRLSYFDNGTYSELQRSVQ